MNGSGYKQCVTVALTGLSESEHCAEPYKDTPELKTSFELLKIKNYKIGNNVS